MDGDEYNTKDNWEIPYPPEGESDASEGNEQDEDEQEEQRRTHPLFKIVAILIALAFAALSYAWLPTVLTTDFSFLKQDKSLSEEELVRTYKPAVVKIDAKNPAKAATIQGTGFIFGSGEMIITNRHLVEEATTVEITFQDDRQLISKDIELLTDYDLAIVRIKEIDLQALQASEQMVKIGQTVTIIGNPRGHRGVSSRGDVKEYYQTDSETLMFTIAVTIAPGSSGSPVLNEQGDLVGIIYASGKIEVDGEEQERAIAIPATILLELVEDK